MARKWSRKAQEAFQALRCRGMVDLGALSREEAHAVLAAAMAERRQALQECRQRMVELEALLGRLQAHERDLEADLVVLSEWEERVAKGLADPRED